MAIEVTSRHPGYLCLPLAALFVLGCPPSDDGAFPCLDDRACADDQFCQGESDAVEGVCGGGADADGDDVAAEQDCDDTDATTFPDAAELCDGDDNDCDSGTEAPGGESDADGDGFLGCAGCEEADVLCGDCDDSDAAANGSDADGDGSSTCDGDCDDTDDDNYPGNSEACDGRDNDCDGTPAANEADADADGYMICEDDCDDGEAGVSPVAQEVCGNPVDENCDGSDERCWLDVAVAEGVTCGLTEQGSALCWGWSDWVDDLEEEPAGPFVALAVSRHRRACALRPDGSVSCWDANGTTIPDGSGPFETICAGDDFACGLAADGLAACWPDQNWSEYPQPVEPLAELDCSADQVCGVAADGQLVCWGDDAYGTISEAPAGGDWVDVAPSHDASCGVRADGEAECWSDLDVWEDVTPPAGPFCAIDVSTSGGGGLGPVCAVRGDPGAPCSGGSVMCWADPIGASPPAGGDLVKVVVSWGATWAGRPGPHACGITSTNLLRCWGGIDGPQLYPPAL